MKNTILILILLIFTEISVSQEQYKTKHNIQISAYGSFPRNFMRRYRTTKESFYKHNNLVIDATTCPAGNIGYESYSTMGSGITAEYIWTFKNNFSVKAGVNMIMHSFHNQVFDEKLAMENYSECFLCSSSNSNYYKQATYTYLFGVSLGVKYSFAKRSSVFFNTSLNYFGFLYNKRVNWLNDTYRFTSPIPSYFSFLELMYYKLGYNYSFNKNIAAFTLIEYNDYLYFGLGIKYNFTVKRD